MHGALMSPGLACSTLTPATALACPARNMPSLAWQRYLPTLIWQEICSVPSFTHRIKIQTGGDPHSMGLRFLPAGAVACPQQSHLQGLARTKLVPGTRVMP